MRNNATTKDRYKSLFLASHDAVMTLEPPNWKFTSANPSTIKLFGVKNEHDFLKYEPWALSPQLQPDGQRSEDKAKQMINEALRDGSNFFTWTHKKVNGQEFIAEVSLSRVEENGQTFLHAVVRDVTEHTKFEEKMKAHFMELESEVSKRTDELSDRIRELEIMNKNMVDRELKMIELKKENAALKKQLKDGK